MQLKTDTKAKISKIIDKICKVNAKINKIVAKMNKTSD